MAGGEPGRYGEYVQRYRRGEWRAPIVHDLIANDIRAHGKDSTVLDIGCGNGFDDDLALQKSLAGLCTRYIGIEPADDVETGDYFTEVCHTTLEDAPLAAESVDVAFAIMVLEHVEHPEKFWGKIHQILKPGGVFWGMTVDARSLFAKASDWLERSHAKDLYMRWLMGKRGEERYLNYPTFYRCNSPAQIEAGTSAFAGRDVINLSAIGQHRPVVPGWMRAAADRYDHWIIDNGKPGTLLLVRLVK